MSSKQEGLRPHLPAHAVQFQLEDAVRLAPAQKLEGLRVVEQLFQDRHGLVVLADELQGIVDDDSGFSRPRKSNLMSPMSSFLFHVRLGHDLPVLALVQGRTMLLGDDDASGVDGRMPGQALQAPGHGLLVLRVAVDENLKLSSSSSALVRVIFRSSGMSLAMRSASLGLMSAPGHVADGALGSHGPESTIWKHGRTVLFGDMLMTSSRRL